MIKIHEVEQGGETWHELRDGKYTGSNAHKLLKFGAIKYSLTETNNFKGNYYTKRGHILEDEALEIYEAINGRRVLRHGFITNSDFPTCGYSPDGIDEAILLEVKCFNQKKHLDMVAGEIPFSILAQIHFGLLICGLREARLIIYNPELEAGKAYKAIAIKGNRNIQNNFKAILSEERAVA